MEDGSSIHQADACLFNRAFPPRLLLLNMKRSGTLFADFADRRLEVRSIRRSGSRNAEEQENASKSAARH